MSFIVMVIQDAMWSALAAAGFAMLFNVPRRSLPGCALIGACGYALRTILVEGIHLPLEPATLASAGLVGFMAMWLAQRYRVPSPVFAVPGVIPMVPGLFAYSAIINLIQAVTATPDAQSVLLVESAINIIKTTLILLAIATGIILPVLLFRREKPVA